MHIQFKNSHEGLSLDLQDRIEKKLTKLSALADTDESQANAVFSLERSVGSHQTGDVWDASVTVDANGTRFHTSELAENPVKASEKVLKEMRAELKKARGKQRALARREEGFWKRFQQRFSRGE